MRTILLIAAGLLVSPAALSAPKTPAAKPSVTTAYRVAATPAKKLTVTAAPGRTFWLGQTLTHDAAIDLDLENATVRDALKQIFERAKHDEYVVDEDVPDTARVSLHVRGVKLSTALDLVTQAAGVQWATERRDGKNVVRIGKSVRRSPLLRFVPQVDANLGDLLNRTRVQFDRNAFVPYQFGFSEQRSTFTCPHCKGQATVLGQRQQPKCPKCERVFQADWQFCPADGSRRPPAAGQWQFCPMCGKRVEAEKAR